MTETDWAKLMNQTNGAGKRRIVLLIVALFLFIIGAKDRSVAEQNTDEVLQSLASRFFENIRKSDFDAAAKLFHYPPNYSSDKQFGNMDGVSSLLEIVTDEFGIPKKYTVNRDTVKYYEFIMGGGDIPYWQQYPDYLKILYEVHFSKEGKGYIAMQFCNILNRWEIRAISYGTSAEGPGAESRFEKITKRILKRMEPLMPQPEEEKPEPI